MLSHLRAILLYVLKFQNALVFSEVVSLVSGLTGAVVISVFSTSLPGNSGFISPRTVPATSVLFSEPDVNVPGTTISRRSSSTSMAGTSCNRPIFPLGGAIKAAQTFQGWLIDQTVQEFVPSKIKPLLMKAVQRWSGLFNDITTLASLTKTKAFEDAGLACLLPKLRRPFEPILEHFRCKLGLVEDDFMEAPPCNPIICNKTETEEREITMGKDIPDMDLLKLKVQTKDECFPGMTKVVYGARVLVKSVDDLPCSDPKFDGVCQELFEKNQIIIEENCLSARYVYSIIFVAYKYFYFVSNVVDAHY